MRILVTGGAGFIGSHVVDALVLRRHRVFVVDDLSTGKRAFVNAKARFFRADVRSASTLQRIFTLSRPEAVIHCAAQMAVRASVENPLFDADVNICGSVTLLEECVHSRVRTFLFASTGGAMYGDAKEIPTPESNPAEPVSPYGVAKLAVEKYLHYYSVQHGLRWVSLRYANVYGPRQNGEGEAGVVAIFSTRSLAGKSLIINGDGRQTRDYLFVEDVVAANLRALERKVSGVFNIGTGRETSVNTIVKEFARFSDRRIIVRHGPAKPGEQRRSALDARLAFRVFGWKPRVPLEEGLAKTFGWFEENA